MRYNCNMVTGFLSFLIFIFASPQMAISSKLEGYWLVTEDNTAYHRQNWERVFVFEKCEKNADKCLGNYGWVDLPDVTSNVLDKNYFDYSIQENDESASFGKWLLRINDESYHFNLHTGKKVLKCFDAEGNLILEMTRKEKL